MVVVGFLGANMPWRVCISSPSMPSISLHRDSKRRQYRSLADFIDIQLTYAFLSMSVDGTSAMTSFTMALLAVPGGPLTYVHPPVVVLMQVLTKLEISRRSSSRPTRRPGSLLRVKS